MFSSHLMVSVQPVKSIIFLNIKCLLNPMTRCRWQMSDMRLCVSQSVVVSDWLFCLCVWVSVCLWWSLLFLLSRMELWRLRRRDGLRRSGQPVAERGMLRWTVHLEGGPRRVNHAAVAVGHKVYSFGGYCSGEDYETLRQIDVHVFNTGQSDKPNSSGKPACKCEVIQMSSTRYSNSDENHLLYRLRNKISNTSAFVSGFSGWY